MDTKLDRILAAIDEAHSLTGELQKDHASDPTFLAFHRHLWIVRHSLNAARAASVDVAGEASKLRDMGKQI